MAFHIRYNVTLQKFHTYEKLGDLLSIVFTFVWDNILKLQIAVK